MMKRNFQGICCIYLVPQVAKIKNGLECTRFYINLPTFVLENLQNGWHYPFSHLCRRGSIEIKMWIFVIVTDAWYIKGGKQFMISCVNYLSIQRKARKGMSI
jgi:hypothetical protein